MNKDILVNTSVDDMRSSLQNMDPTTLSTIENWEWIAIFKKNIRFEKNRQNRTTVIKLLEAKIKAFVKYKNENQHGTKHNTM